VAVMFPSHHKGSPLIGTRSPGHVPPLSGASLCLLIQTKKKPGPPEPGFLPSKS
jgi:hypothetical protein